MEVWYYSKLWPISVWSLIKNVIWTYLLWATYNFKLCAQTVCTPNRHVVDNHPIPSIHPIRHLTLNELNRPKIDLSRPSMTWYKLRCTKGTFQKRFSGFCPLRGYPPPYPLNGKSVWKKRRIFSLAERGGTPPPLTEKSAKTFLKGSLIRVSFVPRNVVTLWKCHGSHSREKKTNIWERQRQAKTRISENEE